MTAEMEKLEPLPCPLCGASFVPVGDGDAGYDHPKAECALGHYYLPGWAIALWNTRPPPQQSGDVGKLREALGEILVFAREAIQASGAAFSGWSAAEDRACQALSTLSPTEGAWTLADVLVMTGCRDRADLEDMANVGKSLMERIHLLTQAEGPFHNWTPADDPAEIVFDLVNHYEDLATFPQGEGKASGEEATGWLIEAWDSKQDIFKAQWWSLDLPAEEDGQGWTKDSTAALRFARERDAQAYIDETGWTEAKATEHAWTMDARSPAPISPAMAEEVARIIDPNAYAMAGRVVRMDPPRRIARRREALDKARAILSALEGKAP